MSLDDSDYKYKPSVSLATGDFNGDGRDQLAVSVGWYNPSDDLRDGFNDECGMAFGLEPFIMSKVTICGRTSSGWTDASSFDMYDRVSLKEQNGEYYTYSAAMMHGAAIAAGDVDNNGVDEIVAVGYVSLTEDDSDVAYARITYKDDEPYSVMHIGDFCRTKLVSSVIRMTKNGYAKTPLKEFDMPQAMSYTFKKYCDDKDWVFAKIAVACGNTNGNNNNATVFIAGELYNYKDFIPDTLFAPNYMAASDMDKAVGGDNTSTSSTCSAGREALGGPKGRMRCLARNKNTPGLSIPDRPGALKLYFIL